MKVNVKEHASVRSMAAIALALLLATGLLDHRIADAQQLRIQVENLQPNDGFFLTPVWFGVHDGSFDFFNAGSGASGSLEALAEEGDVSGLLGDFSAAQPNGHQGVVLSPGGFSGAPVFDPGESAFSLITINNPASNQYFSYASMVIPSNDAFIGNDGPQQYQLFDNNGDFIGPTTIDIFGADIWDSGTEVNDPFGGAAFSANGGTSTSEFLNVRLHPGLNDFLGTDTVAGTTINSPLNAGTPLARITITQVPEPASVSFVAIGAAAMLLPARRRRR